MESRLLKNRIEEIEDSFFRDRVYSCCPKKVRLYQIKDIINSVFDEIEGKVYDQYYDIELGALIYGLLNQKNKEKYVERKYVLKDDIEDKQKSFGGKLDYYLNGNRKKTSNVDHLLITSDYKYKNSYFKMLLDNSIERPRRLLFAPFFCLVNRCDMVDIVEKLSDKGITDLRKEIVGGEIHYTDIHEDICMYNRHDYKTAEEEITLIKRIFGDFFSIRDFKNSLHWLKVLLPKLNENEAKEYKCIWNEVEDALRNAEHDISDKEHIVINWLDALRYDNLANLPYTNKIMRDGIFFEKMYGHIFDTSATAFVIFTGNGYIENRGFEQCAKDYSSSELVSILKRNEYGIVESGQMLKYWREDLERECIGALYNGAGLMPCSLINFRAVCQMQEQKKSLVFVQSSGSEIHVPSWCPEATEKRNLILQADSIEEREKWNSQIKASEKYVDEQMEFYQRFWSKAKYQIIMSDHGQPEWENCFTIEGICHTVFAILGSSVKQKLISNVNSLLSFPDIIRALLNDTPNVIDNNFGKSYALVENDDPYSKRVFLASSENMKGNREEQWYQYRGIVGNDDTYVLFASGKEYYFRAGNEVENLITDENFRTRVDELRKICGKLFIDIYKEKKYKVTREIYESRGLHRSDKNIYV